MHSDTIPDSPHHVIDDIRHALADKWHSLKDAIRHRFHLLSDEDVNAVNGRYDELSRRVSKAYGYDDKRAQEEISRFVSEGGGSAMPSTPDPSQVPSPPSRVSGAGHEH